MEFNNLPIDIIKYCILPNLYDKNILDHFKGDPETGFLVLKDPWNAPHLNLISQFKNIMECSKVNVEMSQLVKHPFDMSFNDKIKFARLAVSDVSQAGKLRKKLAYKIANRIKIKNTDKTIEMIENEFYKKVKYNKFGLIKEMKEKFEPIPYNYSNDVCLNCYGQMPLYSPSIRKYWKRSIQEGFKPHQILKRFCSKRCHKQSVAEFKCSKCDKGCRPGTDIKHCFKDCIFRMFLCNTQTGAVSIPKDFKSAYPTEFVCSMKCKARLNEFQNEFNQKNVLIRSDTIETIYGFVIDQNIIDELLTARYIVRESLSILNPNAAEFNP